MDLTDLRIAKEDPGIAVADHEYDEENDDNDGDNNYLNDDCDLPDQIADHRSGEEDEYNGMNKVKGTTKIKIIILKKRTLEGKTLPVLMEMILNKGQEVEG